MSKKLKDDLFGVVFRHKKADFDERTKIKLIDLINALDDKMIENLLIYFDTNENQYKPGFYLNLATFLGIIKDEMLKRALFISKKTELINAKDLTYYEKEQLLNAYYYKKEISKLPKWAIYAEY